jgi:HEAT repeat protein/hemin uptake protein HemP
VSDTSPEQGLIAQLASDKRSVVIGAVVQLAKISTDPEVIYRLRKLAESNDRELSFFAAQAIAKIQARLGQKPEESSGGAAPSPGPGAFLDRTTLLAPLKVEIPRLLALIRERRAQIPDEVKPAVAVFLSKNGGEEDVPWLVEQLKATDSNLVLPFLEALEALSPTALQPLLPDLLASTHPLVRGRAITALRRIDPEEAEAHLAELLASRRQEDRLAGLSIAFLFPFPKVRELLFAILQEETDPEVLKGCGTLLASNPEVDSALRLLDLIDTTADKKQAATLTTLFKVLCQALAATGLVPAAEATPEAMLARWRQERLKKFLADLEVQITLTAGPRRDALATWLSRNMDLPEVRATVERLALNPATEELARQLQQAYAKEKQLAALAGSPGQYGDEDKRQFLRALDEEGFKLWADWVREEARSGSPMVRVAALHALARLDSTNESLPIAEAAMRESDPSLQAAASRVIEKADARKLLPFLPAMLASSDTRLRARGIKIARQHDEAAALQALAGMLASPDPATRANAVGSLFLFPVEKVSSLLLTTLEKEDHSAIARQILVVLLSNPSVELLDQLDRVHARSNPSVSMTIAQARMDLFDLILQLGLDDEAAGATRAKRGAPRAEKTAAGQAPPSSPPAGSLSQTGTPAPAVTGAEPVAPEATAAPKPYAVAQVRAAMRSRQTAKREEALNKDKAAGGEWRTYALVLALITVLAFLPSMFLRLLTPSETGSLPARPEPFDPRKADAELIHRSEIPDGVRMNRMGRIIARVKEVRPDGLVAIEHEAQTYLLEGIASLPFLVGNDEVEVELLPYQKLKDGSIVAECHSFKPRS